MKAIYLGTLLVGMLVMTSCPRPFSPNICAAPDSLTVDATCYNVKEGLIVRASELAISDPTIRYEWGIFIFADSLGTEYFDHPQLTINGPHQIVVPDSLLKNNQKIYVRLDTHCGGKENAPGVCYNQFVKRYIKSDFCYQWQAQPF